MAKAMWKSAEWVARRRMRVGGNILGRRHKKEIVGTAFMAWSPQPSQSMRILSSILIPASATQEYQALSVADSLPSSKSWRELPSLRSA